MATEQPLFKVGTQLAGADLSALQYTFVKLNSSGQVVAASVLGEKVFGVLQNKPTQGQPAEVTVIGVTKLVSSAAITAGDKLMTAANGKGATAATTGSTIVGVALETAGSGAADIISAAINCLTGVV